MTRALPTPPKEALAHSPSMGLAAGWVKEVFFV